MAVHILRTLRDAFLLGCSDFFRTRSVILIASLGSLSTPWTWPTIFPLWPTHHQRDRRFLINGHCAVVRLMPYGFDLLKQHVAFCSPNLL